MTKKIIFKYYNILIQSIYNRALKRNGYTPLGVCWNSKVSQYKRFKILTSLLENFSSKKLLKLADIGCGYAELLSYLKQENKIYLYEGYDINKKMIEFCKKKFVSQKFFVKNHPIKSCDVSIMSGTYNYAVTDDIVLWEEYILHNLSKCFEKSNLGIVFNLQFEKKRTIRNNIYYTEVWYMLKLLKNNFKNVVKYYSLNLKHDIFFIIYKN